MGGRSDAPARLFDDTPSVAGSASLGDIQHWVILMQENPVLRPLPRHPARRARLL